MARLGDICTIQSGGTPSRGNKDYWNDGTIPWVKISDFSGKYLGNTSEKITQAGLDNSSAKIFPKGTILYTIFATLGETCILDIDASTNQAIAGLKLNDASVSADYLYYYLLSKKEYVKEIGRGVAQNNINMKILREMEIVIPTKEEQNRITEALNMVCALIDMRKEQIAKLDRLVNARFVEMFGDLVLNPNSFAEGSVSDYCKMTQGTQIPMSDQVSEYRHGYYRYLYIRDLKYNDDNWIYVQDKYDDKKLTKKDLVVVNTGNTAGEIYYGKDGILSNNLFKVSFDDNVLNTTYMFAYFRSQQFQSMLWSEMKEGTQPHLGHKIFGSKKLIVPPMELQEQFAAFVEQTDKSKLTIQASLDKLELLKKSLMQEYFG